MTLSITQSATAVAPKIGAWFLGQGGAEPYLYEVVSGGAGGTIDAETGQYTAPSTSYSEPAIKRHDTIRVTDYDGNIATASILVGLPIFLFCEIIQKEMGLANGRVYLWDQKIEQPKDSELYIAVSIPMAKPFGNVNKFNGTTNESDQSLSMSAMVDIDIISRGSAARDRKEEIVMAFESDYARQQQDANSFYIGKLDTKFTNIGDIDGAAIPYRYRISVRLQYVYIKSKPVSYFDTFDQPPITSES